MATLKPDWEKLATTLQGLGVPKSLPNPATTPVNFNIKPAPTTPTAQKGGMVDIPAGYNYSSTQGLYKDPSYGITNAQQNLMNDMSPLNTNDQNLRYASAQRDIERQMDELWQPAIDMISKTYERRLSEERERSKAREARTRALQGSKGLLSSEAGTSAIQEAEDLTASKLSNIQEEWKAAENEIRGRWSSDEKDRIAAERARILGEEKLADEKLEKIRTRKMEDLKTLGASGLTLGKMKELRPDIYRTLQEGTGLSDLEMDAYLTTNAYTTAIKEDPGSNTITFIKYKKDGSSEPEITNYRTDLQPGEKPIWRDGKIMASGKDNNGKYYERELTEKKYESGIIGEYNFYADQEKKAGKTPLSFDEYQNRDANRKAKVALASQIADASGMTPKQQSTFLTITNKFQADQTMKSASDATNAIAIADQVIANPSNASNQLMSLYTLVKGLDPNSAVREGEISLAQSTQSYLSRWQTQLEKIGSGKILDVNTAKQLAQASKDLANLWYQAGKRRESQYKAQAKSLNVGTHFDDYLSSYERPYSESQGQTPATPFTSSSGKTYNLPY